MPNKKPATNHDQRVTDYIRTLNQLRKDTNLQILSFDWSEPIIETPEGKIYAVRENEQHEYYAELCL